MKQHLRPIMFVGTCSDAGKSVINAAFCRIFKARWLSTGTVQGTKYVPQFLLYPGRWRDGPGASRTSGGLRYFPAYGYEPDITKADK